MRSGAASNARSAHLAVTQQDAALAVPGAHPDVAITGDSAIQEGPSAGPNSPAVLTFEHC